ncbi:MAG: hypothetical protein COB49_04190 [Alphaproteobacteria bacterium]|nr:MAG: hypothetical protein COB49_04190 [Alphaproteobacteria bacterium]
MLQVKTVLLSLLILFSGGNLSAQTTQTPLLSDLDIPLMKGFVEEDGSRMVFDTPQGRIIEVRASGPQRAAQVLDYYRVVLPSLSWVPVAEKSEKSENCDGMSALCLMARRDGEMLILKIREIKEPSQKTVIYFSLNPE